MILRYKKDTATNAAEFASMWHLETEFHKLTGKTIEEWQEYPENDDSIIEKLLDNIEDRTFIVEYIDENVGYFNIYELI
jgi:hypothetical protein